MAPKKTASFVPNTDWHRTQEDRNMYGQLSDREMLSRNPKGPPQLSDREMLSRNPKGPPRPNTAPNLPPSMPSRGYTQTSEHIPSAPPAQKTTVGPRQIDFEAAHKAALVILNRVYNTTAAKNKKDGGMSDQMMSYARGTAQVLALCTVMGGDVERPLPSRPQTLEFTGRIFDAMIHGNTEQVVAWMFNGLPDLGISGLQNVQIANQLIPIQQVYSQIQGFSLEDINHVISNSVLVLDPYRNPNRDVMLLICDRPPTPKKSDENGELKISPQHSTVEEPDRPPSIGVVPLIRRPRCASKIAVSRGGWCYIPRAGIWC